MFGAAVIWVHIHKHGFQSSFIASSLWIKQVISLVIRNKLKYGIGDDMIFFLNRIE